MANQILFVTPLELTKVIQLQDISVEVDAMRIPQEPSRSLDPEDWHPDHMLRFIQDIRAFMRWSRPILTPRVILSRITNGNKASLDIVLPYCGYPLETGHW